MEQQQDHKEVYNNGGVSIVESKVLNPYGRPYLYYVLPPLSSEIETVPVGFDLTPRGGRGGDSEH